MGTSSKGFLKIKDVIRTGKDEKGEKLEYQETIEVRGKNPGHVRRSKANGHYTNPTRIKRSLRKV